MHLKYLFPILVFFITDSCISAHHHKNASQKENTVTQKGFFIFDGTVLADADLIYFVPVKEKIPDSNYMAVLAKKPYLKAFNFTLARIDFWKLSLTYGEFYELNPEKPSRRKMHISVTPVIFSYSVPDGYTKDSIWKYTDTVTFKTITKPLKLIVSRNFISDDTAVCALSAKRAAVLEQRYAIKHPDGGVPHPGY